VRELRARSKTVDIAVHTLQGYRDHRSGRNAVTISYYGFISVFPLMLVFTTVLGFVLHNNPKLLADIQDSALAQLPFIGEQITTDPTQLHGSVFALVAGLAVSLWGGMKAFVAVHLRWTTSARNRSTTARTSSSPGSAPCWVSPTSAELRSSARSWRAWLASRVPGW